MPDRTAVRRLDLRRCEHGGGAKGLAMAESGACAADASVALVTRSMSVKGDAWRSATNVG
jgi:hypothetical protein